MAEEQLFMIQQSIDAQKDGSGKLYYEAYDQFARHILLAKREVEVISVDEDGAFRYLQPTSKKEVRCTYLGFGKDSVIEKLRANKIFQLEGRKKQILTYIGWQKERISEWKEMPLQPIQ